MKKYRSVYVEWIDSSSVVTSGWKREDELPDSDPILCRSIGFLYEKSKKAIRILATYYKQPSGLMVDGVTDIPLVAVKKLRYLN